MTRARFVFGALTLAAGLLLAGCTEEPWQTKDISGLMKRLDFDLVAEDGRPVTARDFQGKVALVFFGYTQCPDVCPTTLARLASVLARLQDPGDVRVLFVSVDPARDTLEILKRYTDVFGPQFIGLRGEKAAIDKLTKRYRVTYGYGEKDASGNYSVSHSGAVFAFDQQGEVRLLLRAQDPIGNIAADLQRLIDER